jgi:UDP-N-acetylglucosamine--N-acetylmuramyl-(pentapeptide) pyrophosphoryl-undecaprenol N-acetylglucosamine transferase
MGAKIILIEQNSYPGVTTRILERYANEVHLSFEDSKKYFKDKEKLFLTGNPVRGSLTLSNKEEALKSFGLSSTKKTLFILGGSLGAGSINKVIADSLEPLSKKNIQIIWQTGEIYFEKYKSFLSDNVKVMAFVEKMNLAYSACDLLLARAGATTLAEILTLGIPSILVPSPNVAENHQYFNAKSLSDKNAALLIEDKNLKNEFTGKVLSLILDENKLNELKKNSRQLSKPDAAEIIAKRAIKFATGL